MKKCWLILIHRKIIKSMIFKKKMKRFWLYLDDGIKNGIKVIGLGILFLIIVYIRMYISPWRASSWFRIGGYIFSGFFIIMGIVLIVLNVVT